MNDLLVRIVLGISLVSLLAVWKFTSPYTLKDYLKDFFKFRSLVFVSAQTLMFLQLFNVFPFLYAQARLPARQGPALNSQLFISAGILLALCGLALAIWAKLTMKQSWGPPAQHEIQKQQKLVIAEPFVYTRNPIYIGLLLYFLGFELALESYFALLVIPFAYLFYRAVLVEEKLLTKHFGKKYTSYASRVRRFL